MHLTWILWIILIRSNFFAFVFVLICQRPLYFLLRWMFIARYWWINRMSGVSSSVCRFFRKSEIIIFNGLNLSLLRSCSPEGLGQKNYWGTLTEHFYQCSLEITPRFSTSRKRFLLPGSFSGESLWFQLLASTGLAVFFSAACIALVVWIGFFLGVVAAGFVHYRSI